MTNERRGRQRWLQMHKGIVKEEFAEGVIVLECKTLDCVNNDKSLYDNCKGGFCNLDDIQMNHKRECINYTMDYHFLKWFKLNKDNQWVTNGEWSNAQSK